MAKDFNVVFEYTAEAGAYAGVRTYTSYRDEAEFRQSYARFSSEARAQQVPVEPLGVTAKEAERMCASVPLRVQLRAIISESMPKEVSLDLLDALVDDYFKQQP